MDEVEATVAYERAALLSTLSRYVAWCIDAGIELDREQLFARRMISFGVTRAFPGMSGASQGNMRSQLLRVSDTLLGRSLDLPQLPAMSAADASAPYVTSELTDFRNWARWQGTKSARQSAMALLALGAGAGLSTRELAGIHACDIEKSAQNTVVHVTQLRPRSVPVLASWQELLLEAVELADTSKPLFRYGHEMFYPNIVTNFVARSAGVGLKPNMQRLRATWLVTHLIHGTPVSALLPAAGITSFESLSRYVKFLPIMSEGAAIEALSGAE